MARMFFTPASKCALLECLRALLGVNRERSVMVESIRRQVGDRVVKDAFRYFLYVFGIYDENNTNVAFLSEPSLDAGRADGYRTQCCGSFFGCRNNLRLNRFRLRLGIRFCGFFPPLCSAVSPNTCFFPLICCI